MREPTPEDGNAIHTLVKHCPPLDINSRYAYLLIGHHFATTSVIALRDGEVVGFISSYLPPEQPDTLFVWQVAVAPAQRGQQLGKRMLHSILSRPATACAHYLEATVSASNGPSARLFSSIAQDFSAQLSVSELFGALHFGNTVHEAEHLYRIGPLKPEQRQPPFPCPPSQAG